VPGPVPAPAAAETPPASIDTAAFGTPTCLRCGYRGRTPTSLATHVCEGATGGPYPCLTCGKGFSTKLGLERHEAMYNVGVTIPGCKRCGRRHCDPRSRQAHESNHTKTPFDCPMCDDSFAAIEGFVSHVKDCHGTGAAWFFFSGLVGSCLAFRDDPWHEFGVRTLQSWALFVVSFGAGIDLSTFKYACPKCEHVLVGIDAFKQHQVGHFAVTMIVCQCCQKKFPSMSLLNRHLSRHRSVLPAPKESDGDEGGDVSNGESLDSPQVDKRARTDASVPPLTAFV
jgi:hypothetical protein